MDEACNHIFRFLERRDMGVERIGSFDFTHFDYVFYCERCLTTETRAISPDATRSILSTNISARWRD